MSESDNPSFIRRMFAKSAHMTITGSATIGSALTGGVDMGLIATGGGYVGDEVSSLILGEIQTRQLTRMERLLELADQELHGYLRDGTLTLPNAHAESTKSLHEILEHLIQIALDSYEERKIPYLAKFFARVACSDLDTAEVHALSRIFDATSWRQLTLLGALHMADAQASLRDELLGDYYAYPWKAPFDPPQTAHAATSIYEETGYRLFLTFRVINQLWTQNGWDIEALELQMDRRLLISDYGDEDEASEHTEGSSFIRVSDLGRRITSMFGLDEIDRNELVEVLISMFEGINGSNLVDLDITPEFLRRRHGVQPPNK